MNWWDVFRTVGAAVGIIAFIWKIVDLKSSRAKVEIKASVNNGRQHGTYIDIKVINKGQQSINLTDLGFILQDRRKIDFGGRPNTFPRLLHADKYGCTISYSVETIKNSAPAARFVYVRGEGKQVFKSKLNNDIRGILAH